ncbi:MAG: hypothetical protein HC941_13195, partial [Microcoleus sp. SU_5_3]|nr:hypothetical protein [Microcoleus sp. SU_5_3]
IKGRSSFTLQKSDRPRVEKEELRAIALLLMIKRRSTLVEKEELRAIDFSVRG